MATLAEVQAAVANEDTKIDALVQAYKDLAAQVAASANDPVALQALVDDANAKAAAIDAALSPAAPPAAPPTAPTP